MNEPSVAAEYSGLRPIPVHSCDLCGKPGDNLMGTRAAKEGGGEIWFCNECAQEYQADQRRDTSEYDNHATTCPECDGNGLDWEGRPCAHCDGYGYYWWEE